MTTTTAQPPAAGHELAKGLGLDAWPSTWPLPQYTGALAPYQLRTHILTWLEDRLSLALPLARHGGPDEAKAARADLARIAAVLRPLCWVVSKHLEEGLLSGTLPQIEYLRGRLVDAREGQLRDSLPERWRLAHGPPLAVDDLWPLIEPHRRLAQLADWLPKCVADDERVVRRAIHLHLDALEPAEVAIVKLGVPVDRAAQARLAATDQLVAEAERTDVARAVRSVSASWTALLPRVRALKPGRTADDAQAPAPRAGLVLESLLGRGGTGHVWRGHDDVRPLAVKLFVDGDVAAALQQARALAGIQAHPNVVQVHYVAQVRDPRTQRLVPCIAAELVEGPPLGSWLHEAAGAGRPVSVADVRRVGLGVLEGVAHLHGSGLEHGDLHSGNVLVPRDGAKIIDPLSSGSLRARSTATRTHRLRVDLDDVGRLCQELLVAAGVNSSLVSRFGLAAFTRRTDLANLREAFLRATALTAEDPGCPR